ncbi:MAG: anti-sigma factor antagonist [Limnochordaceae bacterium]|nr:anti-sigma factor antagonist [Limnochordaceae bacterium]
MSVNVQLQRNGPVLVARVAGELDMASAAQLRDPIEQAWNADERLRHVLINLKALTFLDSTGIAVILGRYRAAAGRGGRLGVAEPSVRVRRMLEISGALRFVEVFDTEADALRRMLPKSTGQSRGRRRRRA